MCIWRTILLNLTRKEMEMRGRTWFEGRCRHEIFRVLFELFPVLPRLDLHYKMNISLKHGSTSRKGLPVMLRLTCSVDRSESLKDGFYDKIGCGLLLPVETSCFRGSSFLSYTHHAVP